MQSGVLIGLVVLFIVGSLYFVYKSASKFKLTKEQLAQIKKRNQALDKQDEEEDNY